MRTSLARRLEAVEHKGEHDEVAAAAAAEAEAEAVAAVESLSS